MGYPTYFESLKEGQEKAVEGYLSAQYVFVYLRTRSELLRDPIKFGPLQEEQSRSCGLRMTKFLLYKARASQQICIGRFNDFTVLKALVDR